MMARTATIGHTAAWCVVAVVAVACVAARDARSQLGPAKAERPPVNPDRPTLWIIGDSTVRNGHDTGDNGQWGWGNPIARFFDAARIDVQNRALGGTSSRSFRNLGQWDPVLAAIRPGDFLLMQFGHNDPGPLDDPARARGTLRGNGEQTREIDNPITHRHEVVHTYGWYLRDYAAAAKAKGAAQVIICSPIPRNAWANGRVARNSSYGPAAAAAAKQAGADFIDLNELTARRYDPLGQARVTDTYFPETRPGQKPEVVHTDWAGAVLNAEMVVEGIKALPHGDLATYLQPGTPPDLDHPPTGRAR